ncbi:MAG: hypothetical protein PXX73_02695, partial [Sideroxydans sp.]|nr:hypothetical protein [Sideroxydans sp.]
KFGGVDKQGNAIGGQAAVDSFFALLDEFNRKGMKDPFKMGEAGFREMYTSKAAMQSLQNVDALRSGMKDGIEWAKTDLISAANAEIKVADFGKIKAAEIVVEKAKLSNAATDATGTTASLFSGAAEFYDNHKVAASTALAGGAVMLARLAYKAVKGGGAGDLLEKVLGKSGQQNVFVTNWPNSMLSPSEQMRQKRESRSGDTVVAGGSASGNSRGARVKSGALSGLKWGGVLTAATSGYAAWEIAHSDASQQDKKDEYQKLAGSTTGAVIGGAIGGATGAFFFGAGAIPGSVVGSTLGGMAGDYLASPEKSIMDNYQAGNSQVADKIVQGINERPMLLTAVVNLNDQQIAEVINAVNARDSRRN